MSLVLDASAALAWLYEEHSLTELDRLYSTLLDQGAHVPQLWRVEVANVLLTGVCKRRHDMVTAQKHMAVLASFKIVVDPETSTQAWNRTFELAMTYNLTTYDACYLELALRHNLALATLDKELQIAARSEKVPLFWDRKAS